MRHFNPIWKKLLESTKVALVTFAGTFLICQSAHTYGALAQQPLFAAKPVIPMMMLNMSKDHQLYFKAYDDYSDLTAANPGFETTYLHSYDYYGYFDSKKCYYYDTTNHLFKPGRWADASNYCNHTAIGGETARIGEEWSGNFLNWASMTRMDTIRKILYGGMRASGGDTNSGYTVLERAFLPNDAHSFAKYYNGSDLEKLVGIASGTLLTADSTKEKNGITICNTTADTAGLSQNSTAAPKMLVAKGNFSLWASNERFQCRWTGTGAGQAQNGGGTRGLNGNTTDSGINAYSNSPSEAIDGIGQKNYTVRVQVCDSAFVNTTNNEKCLRYPNGYYKPIGLLHKWGADDTIHFGLMTGSYAKNKSGGVLRKNIGSFTDELDPATGQFTTSSTGNIVTTINALRTYGYRFGEGTYFGTTGSDSCSWGWTSFSNGACSNWGNPQSEIFLESLRYFAGLSKTTDFDATDSTYISGLPAPSWSNPVTSTNKCAPLNVLQFNASVSSYDHDEITANITGIAGKLRPSGSGVSLDVDVQTNLIGAGEGLDSKPFFIADNGTTNDGLCNAKTLSTLAGVTGTCPEAPRLGASYRMAGLAYYANRYGVNVDRETVKTYGVALQPSIPSVSVPVPGVSGKAISILPACRNTFMDPDANCAIVDFKVVSGPTLSSDGTKNEGTLYVNWEDSEQGGDYDQDMWGVIKYSVSSTTVSVTTNVIAQSTPNSMGFGYVIGGTLQDGFHAHSGINSYTYDDIGTDDCASGCVTADDESTQEYDVGTSTAGTLKNPLWYASKWGGYESKVYNSTTKQWEYPTEPPKDAVSGVWEEPDAFFYSTDPRNLEQSLDEALGYIAETAGSASAVATNSTRVDGERLVYQARFDSRQWSGQVLAFKMDANGDVITLQSDGKTSAAVWDTDTRVVFPGNHLTRKVYTYNNTSNVGVEFLWANLSSTQQTLFKGTDTDTLAQDKIKWLRGDRSKEGSDFRERASLIGDIVNSDPAYAGQQKYSWYRLPVTYKSDGTVDTDAYGATTYRDYVANKKAPTARVPMLLVGANDGMLHVLNGDTGSELFSYVPRGVLNRLGQVPNPDYTSGGKHIYTMDGSVFVGDVYDASHSTQKWRTYAVATLGAGGKGVFVLDITDIDKDGNGFDPAKHVILDWTEAELPDMGNVLSRPIIAPMKDGNWYVIFGNGPENTLGKSQLILINLSTKTAITKEVSGSSGGLMAPALLPNQDMLIEFAYAGDLSGNIWKFDLSDKLTSKWEVAYGGDPFVTLRDKDDKLQPITSAPTLGLRFANGSVPSATMVYVGTGRYLYNSDNVPKSDVQSFYGLADEDGAVKPLSDIWKDKDDRDTVLHKKEISKEEFSSTQKRSIREIKGEGRFPADTTDTKVNWASKKGWYLDLIPPASSAQGEMVISKPLLIYDRLIFPTLIPSDQSCDAGGKGWIMDLSAVGDRYDATHRVLPESGLSMEDPAMSLSEAIESGENIYIPVSNIKGEIVVEKGKTPLKAPKGRSSWRQIK